MELKSPVWEVCTGKNWSWENILVFHSLAIAPAASQRKATRPPRRASRVGVRPGLFSVPQVFKEKPLFKVQAFLE